MLFPNLVNIPARGKAIVFTSTLHKFLTIFLHCPGELAIFGLKKKGLIMSYEFSYNERGFVLRFKGNVTIEELNEANGKIHGHAKFDYHRYQIIDLLEANLSSVTKEDAKEPAATDAIASLRKWNVKVVLVAIKSDAVKAAKNYVERAQRLAPTWKFEIFSNFEDALRWAKT